MTVHDQDICFLSCEIEECHDEEVVVPICQREKHVHVRTPTMEKQDRLSERTKRYLRNNNLFSLHGNFTKNAGSSLLITRKKRRKQQDIK